MADIDVSIRQCAAIEFLNVEGETPIRIHGRLKNTEEATVDVSIIRLWVRRCIESGWKTPLADEKRSDGPATSVTPRNI